MCMNVTAYRRTLEISVSLQVKIKMCVCVCLCRIMITIDKKNVSKSEQPMNERGKKMELRDFEP